MRSLRATGIALALGLLAGPAVPAEGSERVVVALGDSLTAGYGVAPEEAWPALVAARLKREGYPYRVVNAGVSGDTTAGGLRRVEWVMRSRPEVAVVALGANDGLRGLGTSEMEANLLAIVERLQAGGARVLVAGMEVPPNYGAAYTRAFREVFPDVARRTGAALMGFLLDGVAADPRLNLSDGIHPNAAGHRTIAERLWPHLIALLTR
jgi:acyl-CoA thioesterase-1